MSMEEDVKLSVSKDGDRMEVLFPRKGEIFNGAIVCALAVDLGTRTPDQDVPTEADVEARPRVDKLATLAVPQTCVEFTVRLLPGSPSRFGETTIGPARPHYTVKPRQTYIWSIAYPPGSTGVKEVEASLSHYLLGIAVGRAETHEGPVTVTAVVDGLVISPSRAETRPNLATIYPEGSRPGGDMPTVR